MIVKDVVLNLAIIVAMSVLSGFIDKRWKRSTHTGILLQGLLFGVVALIGMMMPFVLTKGLIFDGRSVVLSLCGLYFGPIPGLIAMTIALIYRVMMGGPGLFMGVSVILSSFLIGLFFYYLRKKGKFRISSIGLYAIGLIVHLVMVGLMILIPSGLRSITFNTLTLTILGAYPVAVVIIGKILYDQEENSMLIKTLEDSEEQFRLLVANMQQGLALYEVTIDRKGKVTDISIKYFNEQFERITGLDRNSIMGKTAENLFSELGAELPVTFESVYISGVPQHFELLLPGMNRTIECDLYRSNVNQFAMVFSDISERKRALVELTKAKEKAEESNKLKSAFLHNISHEVRTPLNGIIGFTGLITQPGISEIDKIRYREMISTSIDRFIQTITNYIDMSQIVSGTMEIHEKPFDLNSLISQVMENCHKIALAKGLSCCAEIGDREKTIIVHSDMELLKKILAQLLDNALKFTSNGKVSLSCSYGSDFLEFVVKDTGEGISEIAKPRIFEIFQQEEISETRKHEGSGLGLSIAGGLVRMLGGTIRLVSAKGSGSEFIVWLPIRIGSNTPKTTTIAMNDFKRSDSCSILIAEDDESNLFYLETILKQANLTIHSALNGKEAVEYCQRYPEIGLVLMDIRMPVMDGMEAARTIKSFRKSLPIIAVTAFAMTGDEKKARDAGCDDYMTKPLNKKLLFQKIHQYTGIIQSQNN